MAMGKMNDGVRCSKCGKKVAEMLVDGLLIFQCRNRRCRTMNTIDKRIDCHTLDKRIMPVLR